MAIGDELELIDTVVLPSVVFRDTLVIVGIKVGPFVPVTLISILRVTSHCITELRVVGLVSGP